MRVLTGLALLVVGVAVGMAAVWVHATAWGLPLGWAATLAALLAAPAGSRRLLYAVGWVVTAGWFVLARPEGDLVVESDARGYAVLGLGLLVVAVAVATVPPRAGRPRPARPAA